MKLITDVIQEIRRGRAVEVASDMLAEVVKAVTETGKKGSVTIKLTVKPDDGGGNMQTIGLSVTSSIPRPTIPDTKFYSDEDGDLTLSDPNQPDMFVEQTR